MYIGVYMAVTLNILQLTSVRTSSTDLKAVDIEASFDCNKDTVYDVNKTGHLFSQLKYCF